MSLWQDDLRKAERIAVAVDQMFRRDVGKLEISHIRGLLGDIKRRIDQLEETSHKSSLVTFDEAASRRKPLSDLKKSFRQLSSQFETACESLRKTHQPDLIPNLSPRDDTSEAVFVKHHQEIQLQEELMREQDSHLDHLEGTVQTLRHIGETISEEADVHHRLLGKIDESVDHTTTALSYNKTLLHDFNANNLNAKLGCVVLVLCVVVIFVLYNAT